jgi:hypothetical protein
MLARVIDDTVEDGHDNPTVYRLFTTMLDPLETPAVELAAAYAQRWEIESVFDELKTHQRGPRVVLRSKSPDLVLQKIWGHLCCHYAIRSVMAQAAQHSGHDPDSVSFTAALRIVRQSVAQQGAFHLNPAAPLTRTGSQMSEWGHPPIIRPPIDHRWRRPCRQRGRSCTSSWMALATTFSESCHVSSSVLAIISALLPA